MRGRGLFGLLFIVVLALLIGGVAYNWGLAAGQTQAVAPGTVAYPVVYGHPFGLGFGFGIFGFLFVFLLIGLLITAFRPRRWNGGPGGGWRGMGPGGGWGPGWGGRYDPNDPGHGKWAEGDVPPPFRPMLEAWHRQAHAGSTSGETPTDAAGRSSGPGDATAPPR
jgi:hypothetical protein